MPGYTNTGGERMYRSFGLIRVLAAVAVLTLAVGVPTASAATKTDKTQTKTIKKHSTQIKRGANAVKKINRAAKTTRDAIAALKLIADRADKNAATILGGAPSILDGLNQLKAGLVAAGAGLNALKDGLEAAGAGLNSLKTLATSTEYGIGQVFVAGSPAAGAFVVTPDIPDAVQQAQTTQTFVPSAPGVVTVLVAVRSAESDGDGTIAAAHCRVTVATGGNSTTSIPNAALGGAPFYEIVDKSPPNQHRPGRGRVPVWTDPVRRVSEPDGCRQLSEPNWDAGDGCGGSSLHGQPVLRGHTSPSTSDPSA